MKRGVIIFLILAGAVFGYWMARGNWRLFELAYQSDSPARQARCVAPDPDRLKRGLEKWQVKEIMGVPDTRSLLADQKDLKKEEWRYGPIRLLFTNGILTSWNNEDG